MLGPPGSGKSTLAQYLAWRVWVDGGAPGGRPARAAGPGAAAGVGGLGLKSSAPETSLPEYLAAVYQDLRPAPATEQWREWLARGDVLLLLDGLDELTGNASFSAASKQALDLFPQRPVLLTCRTVSSSSTRRPAPSSRSSPWRGWTPPAVTPTFMPIRPSTRSTSTRPA